jgi:bifunctional non-homologous end joining protein LigD
MKNVVLYCTEGSSNKEYHLELFAKDGGYVVNTRHGPRGRATVQGTLTESPVSLEAATRLYDARLKRQHGKGYTQDLSGAGYTNTPDAERVSGWRAALLAPIDEDQLHEKLDSDEWVGSEKMDGERRAVEVTESGILGINRKGLYVGVPDSWTAVLSKLPVGTIVDGEHVGDHLYIFDCVQLGAEDIRKYGYEERHDKIRFALKAYTGPDSGSPVTMVRISRDPAIKRAMLATITAANGEGMVFRNRFSSYEAGLSEFSFKFKLHESATCIVAGVNGGKRSVSLALLDADMRPVPVGNVTIPGVQPIPSRDDLVEVRYMHMFEGGSLYQPVYKGVRTDIEMFRAQLTQVRRIKLKGSAGSQEADDSPDSGAIDATEPVAASVAVEPARRRMRA